MMELSKRTGNPVAAMLSGMWCLPNRPKWNFERASKVLDIPRKYFSSGPHGRIERGVLLSLAVRKAAGEGIVTIEEILERERLDRLQLRDAITSLLEHRLLTVRRGLLLLTVPDSVTG